MNIFTSMRSLLQTVSFLAVFLFSVMQNGWAQVATQPDRFSKSNQELAGQAAPSEQIAKQISAAADSNPIKSNKNKKSGFPGHRCGV